MTETKRKYDSTVARIAGNIASGFVSELEWSTQGSTAEGRDKLCQFAAIMGVKIARAIVAEVERTESSSASGAPQP